MSEGHMRNIKKENSRNLGSICIISTVHPPHDQRIFHKQAKSSLHSGWDVSFVVHSSNSQIQNGVNIISLGEANSRPQRWMHLSKAYRKAIKTGADIYHLHDPELLPIGYLLKRNTDAVVIFDMHEDFVGNKIIDGHREWIPEVARPLVAQLFPSAFSWFVSRIDAVVTTTSSMADRVGELGANRVELVRNFPKIRESSIENNTIEKDHKYQLVYVGRLTEERGVLRMLRTLKNLQEEFDIGLWLLGTFVNDYEESKAIEYINKNDLNVRRFGYVEYDKIFSILGGADIGFALLDKTLCKNNISTKIFEYMYTETPYVGTDAPTMQKYTCKDTGILVPEDDITATTNAIRDLINDINQLRQMGKYGRNKVKSEYNWESEFAKLADLYSTSLNKPV